LPAQYFDFGHARRVDVARVDDFEDEVALFHAGAQAPPAVHAGKDAGLVGTGLIDVDAFLSRFTLVHAVRVGLAGLGVIRLARALVLLDAAEKAFA